MGLDHQPPKLAFSGRLNVVADPLNREIGKDGGVGGWVGVAVLDGGGAE